VLSAADTAASTKVQPYTALQLEGRDVYIREGCYNCHSQMIRPFTWEVARYGDASSEEDSIFDHPFQWGSKRTGPDLARVGGRYSHLWHYKHLVDPREVSPGSNMPPYGHLAGETVDFAGSEHKMRAMRSIGVPYAATQVQGAAQAARAEADAIAAELKQEGGIDVAADSRMVALIAYLQRLGRSPAPQALASKEAR